MSRRAILIVAATVCLLFTVLPDARAQSSNRSVGRPRVNPYSDFLRRSSGMYDPMITPFLRQNNAGITRRQTGNTNSASSALLGGSSSYGMYNPEADRARARSMENQRTTTMVAPTGSGSTFMQYSHFYQVRRPARR